MTDLLERFSALRQHPSKPSAADAVFRNEGQFWTIAYEGQMFRLRDVKRLGYIASLLASPGREVHVLEFVTAATGHAADEPVGTLQTDLDPALDEQAKADYARRLGELEEELEEARDWRDTERAARLEDEPELLTQELGRAVGLRGRDRTFSSPAERARISVTKAIKTAIRLIDKHCPELSAHRRPRSRPGGSAPTRPPAFLHRAGLCDVTGRGTIVPPRFTPTG